MSRLPNADAAPAKVHRLTLRAASSGRLDAVLATDDGIGLSRTRLKSLISAGAVTVNGVPATDPAGRIRAGDLVEVEVPAAAEASPKPQAIALEILYEDADVIVIDKAAGMVVHPAPGHSSGTLVNALIHHCGASLTGIGGVLRPGIVHRLDKDTSGVMVAAKNEAAMAALSAQFADHGRSGELERAYLALVWGEPRPRNGTIDAPLGRSPANRLKRAVVRAEAADAKPAITDYSMLEAYAATAGGGAVAAMVECRLRTGRTHQIRVHMAHLGHPLIGDREYGAGLRTKAELLPEPARGIARDFARQALHAHLLAFRHPGSGDILRFRTAPPPDFRALRDVLAASTGIACEPPYAKFI